MDRTKLEKLAEELQLLVEVGKDCRDTFGLYGGALDLCHDVRQKITERRSTLEALRKRFAELESPHPEGLAALDEWEGKLERADNALRAFCIHDRRPGRLGHQPPKAGA